MNKYAALGLLIEASKGKRVAVISPSQRAAQSAMREFEVPLADGWKARTANGSARINAPSGGSIVFRSMSQSHRGLSFDAVFVDSDADALLYADRH